MTSPFRTENDFLGELTLPINALYGIHAARARENFPASDEKHDPYFLRAYLLVKEACIKAAGETELLDEKKAQLLIGGIINLLENPETLAKNIVCPVHQGGAGTSLNMNINEVICNRALELANRNTGDYVFLHPNDHANAGQSTNDTYPTALKIAVIWRLRELTEAVCTLQEGLQAKEKEFAGIVKIGRTQMQNALPITLGMEFGSWAEAIARDRWRLYKAEERLREVNLGGTAIGTGTNASRRFTFLALQYLRSSSGVGVAKAENLVEATSNQDLFLEAAGWMKALAANLHKIAQDIRYLSSSPVAEIKLPAVQVGSSIMPGKVNPVMPELLIQTAMEVYASEGAISTAVMQGNLELNPWLPLIARHFLNSLQLLTESIAKFNEKCLNGIEAIPENCFKHLAASSSLLTALNPILGYEKVAELVKESMEKSIGIQDLLTQKELFSASELEKLLSSTGMLKQKKD